MAATPAVKSMRLEARIAPALKRQLEKAAQLSGRSLSEFVVEGAREKADQVLRENQALVLSKRAQIQFAKLLLDPPAPTRQAVAGVKLYRKMLAK